ncbi:DUF4097 family beta strand repeat-containing protein [Streptomyces sp. TRM68367]|uniref:DUF4097 family beta strand repeat-containing protein n=1 Tax=Streptomyces sp. TRM68367 TaxID=2758415 RepID=UPI00165AA603|nr:DUF4097 family beta strand repeat-containing protein [Streptomyces sp. TRM68367]MBC9730977.1 DUF4097 family beta strand repeat protein [Streptomyces sp. TRM68367]
MFSKDQLASLTDADRDELIRDFMTEYGVSEPTAAMATNLFITIASAMPEDQAQEEFQRAVTQMLAQGAQGESWAQEFIQAMFNKRLPGFRATYQRAITAGQDPAAQLVREHAMPAAAAAELVTLLKSETGVATTKPADEQNRQEAPAGRPYLADVTCPSGTVKVTVDPTVTVPSARVRTDDKTGPSADAVRRSTVSLDGDRLTVRVPEIEGVGGVTQIINTGRGTRIYQSAGVVYGSVTGVTIDGNGNMTIGGVSGGVASSPIEVLVTLPAGSGVKVDSHNAHLEVDGPLAALRMDTHNGHVRAGVVGRARIDGHNGNYTFEAIQESVDIDSHNGHTTIGSYHGSDARVTTHNGTLNLAATPHATGPIVARTHNGSITLRGVRGRQDLDVRTSTHNGSVHKI